MPYSAYAPYSGQMMQQSKYIPCYQQDGKIYTWDSEGTRQIGVSTTSYEIVQKELDAALIRLKNYIKHLTEKQICPHCDGEVPPIIAPEPSAQDIIQQQTTQLKQAQDALVASQKTQQQLIEGNLSLAQRVQELMTYVSTLTGGSNESIIVDQSTSNSGSGSIQSKKPTTKS